MSSRKSTNAGLIALFLVAACIQAVDRARPVGHCQLEIAYVEGGTTPSVYWMRLCEQSVELQPLGGKASVRHIDPQRLSRVQNLVASVEFAEAIQTIVRQGDGHKVPPDHAFYVIRYGGDEIQITSDELPSIARNVFDELHQLFRQVFSSYRDYLKT